jgi:hypothetical protein
MKAAIATLINKECVYRTPPYTGLLGEHEGIAIILAALEDVLLATLDGPIS